MKTTRRNLIRSAAVLPLTAVKGSAANSAVSIGVVGVGNRGSYLARLVSQNAGARVAAISDVNPERMDQVRKGLGAQSPEVFADYRKLLDAKLDAVIIATPVFLHAEHFEAAIKSGKHIYIEKPAASSIADCKRIMQLADGADRRIHISFGFQRRYGYVYQQAKKALDSGAIGRIRWANIQFVKSEGGRTGPSTRPATMEEKIRRWGAWRELSGDLIVENNIHLIDVMNWFLGARPLKAIGTGGRTLERYGDTRDHGQVTYTYPGNVQGTLLGTVLAPPFYRNVYEQFHGPNGVIETSENYWKHFRGRADVSEERSPREISADSINAFVSRLAEAKPENTGVRGVESTLSAILGRMAMDLKREVTWEEMLQAG
ncbi:MAG: Gfo/Idh/MocA family oxidoreductase [Acidimicrobiia bacterium]|nr:Gfo/Idh/MocA family oxidoreductase [Acidimicrobiia bacterium]